MLRRVLLALLLSGAAVSVNNRGATVARGVLRLNVTACGPPNLLPAFKAMSAGGESIEHLSPNLVTQQPEGGTEAGFFDISCPDDIFENALPTGNGRHLPYRLLDQYRSERVPTDVPTLELTDPVSGLKAIVTPQWGGKVYALRSKEERELIMMTDPHQPIPSSVRNAQVDGGIEWNWSPGLIGHWADTEDHVFAARVATERGDVLRVFAFDRFNETAFSVDMIILNGTLFTHPKVHNPNAHEIDAYWWTNAGQPFRAANQNCKPSEANPGSRIISPASYTVDSGSIGRMRLSPWPFYSQFCCQGWDPWSPGIDYSQGNAGWAPDMSWMANFIESSDIFLRILQPQRPSVSIVDKDIFGSDVGLYHGHSLNGTKFFEGGAGRGSQRWFFHETAPASPNGPNTNNAGGCGDCGCFTELQIGVAPTQENIFKMSANTTREWTEFFATMGAVKEKALYSSNYSEALEAVDSWLESSDGIPAATYAEVDAWLAGVAKKEPTEMLHEGGPWGAIELERVRMSQPAGTVPPIPASMPFTVGKDYAKEAQPWLELMHNGTFSAETLADPIPVSWMVSAPWAALIGESATKHGTTWLHECYLGVMAAEAWRLDAALAHFHASMRLQPTPIVARNLAALAPVTAALPTGNPTDRWALYQHAWQLAVALDSDSGKLLTAHLAGEIGAFLRRGIDLDLSS